MTTQERFVARFDGSTAGASFAPQRGVLTGLLRPFAGRPHVFVCDDASATRVTIHKTEALDIELVIATDTKRWSATVRDVVRGIDLARATADFGGASASAMCADLHAFLATVVDAGIRFTPDAAGLEVATATGWRPLTCFA